MTQDSKIKIFLRFCQVRISNLRLNSLLFFVVFFLFHSIVAKMSTPEERAVQEALPMDATEAEILEKLKKDLGEEMIAKMSFTQVLQCIRGWQTEKDRYDATITNVRRIIEFKEQARSEYSWSFGRRGRGGGGWGGRRGGYLAEGGPEGEG